MEKLRETLPKTKPSATPPTPDEFLAQSLKLLEALSRLRLAGEANRKIAAAWFAYVTATPATATAAHAFYK